MENEKIILPEDFLESVRDLLKDEYDEFLASYEKERAAGLRWNPLKADLEDFHKAMDIELKPVDWAMEGFYYSLSDQPGKTVLHEAGAFYIQEPSAMCAVSLLDPQPGDYCLDLCAAPGGKSTQIAGRLLGRGLLVSNEYVSSRAGILSANIERMGVANALVLNESSERLAEKFPLFFDKILVDAPCSGEGMFKKEPNAIPEWSLENVKICHERQVDILNEAAKMCRPGGVLVYSTCTFNSLENEGSVEAFLENHPDFTLEKTERFWPHRIKGEGHFAARFVKSGVSADRIPGKILPDKSLNEVKKFLSEEIHIKSSCMEELFNNRSLTSFTDNIYLLPEGILAANLKGLRVERPGLHLCVSKKNRFEPSHSLALALKASDVESSVALTDEEALKYIKGETINCDPSIKGWVLLTTRGFSIGFGKASGGIIKNHYPKGLRK